jgi:hypothetical protein
VVTGFIDAAQVGFRRPAPPGDPGNHALRARNIAAMWPGFRDAGARCLVVVGEIPDQDTLDRYAAALPAMRLTVCRLRAGPGELAERVFRRGRGGGPPIPGDELAGLPPAALRRAAAEVARTGAELDRAGLGDVCVDTDRRSPAETADLVFAATGWPPVP